MRVFASAETTSICILVLAAALCGAGQAAAQQPSEDQIAAVKSNWRSDFMAKCWGVPRGGTEAFQCLKKNHAAYCAGVEYGDGRQLRCLESNKASLSPDCQGALAKLAQ
jgi:hypothetical protein